VWSSGIEGKTPVGKTSMPVGGQGLYTAFHTVYMSRQKLVDVPERGRLSFENPGAEIKN
jgi:hypothetical protein